MLEAIIAICILGGVYLGHFITMKAIGHVQPSTKEIVKQMKRNVQIEPDPWATDEIPEEAKKEFNSVEDLLEQITARTGKKPEDIYGVER